MNSNQLRIIIIPHIAPSLIIFRSSFYQLVSRKRDKETIQMFMHVAKYVENVIKMLFQFDE